jgi:hypothetical protein
MMTSLGPRWEIQEENPVAGKQSGSARPSARRLGARLVSIGGWPGASGGMAGTLPLMLVTLPLSNWPTLGPGCEPIPTWEVMS